MRASKRTLALLSGTLVALLALMLLVVAELIARKMERSVNSGSNLVNVEDNSLGWLPSPGEYRLNTKEFETRVFINSLGMGDDEPLSTDAYIANRVLVLGDSHTFALGASTHEVWANQLENILGSKNIENTVYNAGVIGYSLGQYLLRFRSLVDTLDPTLVIVGFSMATDLYDLIPPERGGFVYGGNATRVYFDLDQRGGLVEKKFTQTNGATTGRVPKATSLRIREFLGQFALYRKAKRSKLAMWFAAHYQPGGESLWPGLDTALKINLSDDDQYRWSLAEAILGQLVREVNESNIPVVIVNIPYLAQVYDDVWQSSFGSMPERYDRYIGSERLQAISNQLGIEFIDTTPAFEAKARSTGRWLHYPMDAHPTPEGHRLIAEVVANSIVDRMRDLRRNTDELGSAQD